MKYPKEWVEAPAEKCALIVPLEDGSQYTIQGTVIQKLMPAILDALNEVGALKEIPEPREWWVCTKCHMGSDIRNAGDTHNYIFDEEEGRYCLGPMVKVREVIE